VIFPQLNIRVKLKPGNILAFKSNLLIHGNLPCFGVRHLLVFFTHNNLFFKTFVNIKNTNSFENNEQKKRKENQMQFNN
jgi:hypothetical protein